MLSILKDTLPEAETYGIVIYELLLVLEAEPYNRVTVRPEVTVIPCATDVDVLLGNVPKLITFLYTPLGTAFELTLTP